MTFSVHSCFLIFVASSRTSCRSECRWDLNWWEMSIIQCLTALFYSWIKNTHQFHLPVPSSHHDLDMGCPFVSPTSPLVISWFQVWKVFSPADRSRRFESMIFCNLNFFLWKFISWLKWGNFYTRRKLWQAICQTGFLWMEMQNCVCWSEGFWTFCVIGCCY